MNRVGVKVTLTLNSKDTVFEILLFSRLKKFSGCFSSVTDLFPAGILLSGYLKLSLLLIIY